MGARQRMLNRTAIAWLSTLLLGLSVRAQPPLGGYQPVPAPVFAGEPTPLGPSGSGSSPGAVGPMPTPMYGGIPGPMNGGLPPGAFGPGAGPMQGPMSGGPPIPPIPPEPPGGGGKGGDSKSPDGSPPPLGCSFFSAFDDRFEGYDRGYSIPTTVSVDFLILKPVFSGKEVAFTSPTGIPGVAPVGTTDFPDNPFKLTPRITIQWMPFDEFGVRGSWYRTNFSHSMTFNNPSSSTQVNSAVSPLGGLNASPQPFGYLSQLPPNIFGGNFPFLTSYDVGSVDTLFFQNSFSIQVADLDFVWTMESQYAVGWLGAGARYTNISHSYAAYRTNPAHPVSFTIPDGYDAHDDDGDEVYADSIDQGRMYYSSVFSGVGPSVSFHGECPKDTWFQLFLDTKVAAVLGKRKETLYGDGLQAGDFFDDEFGSERFRAGGPSMVTRSYFTCVPVAEVEAGISVRTGSGGLRPVVKVAGIAQYWWNAGSTTDSTTNLFMYGLDVSLGFQF